MDISIIIVSWRVKDLLKKCLESILASTGVSFEIIVVDNNSADGTAEMLSQDFSGQIKFIKNDKNLGFAKANNLGLKQATGDYVLFLNPDTEIQSDTLAKSLNFMKQHPNCGIMGSRMYFKSGEPQPSVRRFPTVSAILLMLFKLPKLFAHLPAIDKYLATDFDYGKEQTVKQVMGAFMLVPKWLIRKIGGFDERFFIWFEEVDLCLAVRKLGYQVIYNPDISIIHYGGKSFSQQALVANQWRFFQSALKYFLKNGFKTRQPHD